MYAQLFPTHVVRIVGHSLGAGVGALVTLLALPCTCLPLNQSRD